MEETAQPTACSAVVVGMAAGGRLPTPSAGGRRAGRGGGRAGWVWVCGWRKGEREVKGVRGRGSARARPPAFARALSLSSPHTNMNASLPHLVPPVRRGGSARTPPGLGARAGIVRGLGWCRVPRVVFLYPGAKPTRALFPSVRGVRVGFGPHTCTGGYGGEVTKESGLSSPGRCVPSPSRAPMRVCPCFSLFYVCACANTLARPRRTRSFRSLHGSRSSRPAARSTCAPPWARAPACCVTSACLTHCLAAVVRRRRPR